MLGHILLEHQVNHDVSGQTSLKHQVNHDMVGHTSLPHQVSHDVSGQTSLKHQVNHDMVGHTSLPHQVNHDVSGFQTSRTYTIVHELLGHVNYRIIHDWFQFYKNILYKYNLIKTYRNFISSPNLSVLYHVTNPISQWSYLTYVPHCQS